MAVIHTKPPARHVIVAGILLLGWLLGTAYGFWWFQFKDLRPFSRVSANKNTFFDGERLRVHLERALVKNKAVLSSDDNSTTTLVHFWDPACACSRFNELHVRQLIVEYQKRGIRFLVLARADAFSDRATLQTKARAIFGDVEVMLTSDVGLNKNIPSSPAAIILDSKQQLAYFGPYSEGAVCSIGTGKFVERILDGVLAGNNPQFINTLAYGCFCDWQKHG